MVDVRAQTWGAFGTDALILRYVGGIAPGIRRVTPGIRSKSASYEYRVSVPAKPIAATIIASPTPSLDGREQSRRLVLFLWIISSQEADDHIAIEKGLSHLLLGIWPRTGPHGRCRVSRPSVVAGSTTPPRLAGNRPSGSAALLSGHHRSR